MAIVDVLKKLHKTMTGKDSVGETIEEVIGDLDENYTGDGGGSSLPDMTDQSGKFLTNDGTDASWGSPAVDSEITSDGQNPVTGGAIYTALAGKADKVESPLQLTGELGEDAEENTTLTITDDYTMHDIYTEVNSGRLVYVDFELGENMKLRAQSIGCHYIPANGGNEAQYSVTFNVITAEDEQGSIVIRFYSASFTNSNTALVVVKTLTAS